MSEPIPFRDRLLAVEPPPADLRLQLEQEIQQMFIRKLSPAKRAFMTVLMVSQFAAAGLCAWLVATESTLPLLARIGLGTGVLFALAWATWFLRILRRGEINVRHDGAITAWMVWGSPC